MASINLYKIKNSNIEKLKEELNEKNYLEHSNEKSIKFSSDFDNNKILEYSMNLYINEENKKRNLSWNWIRSEFNLDELHFDSKPSAILLIKEKIKLKKKNTTFNDYAISFGYAYHIIENHFDQEWSFSFAEHNKYNSVKTMTISSPNSIINRKINNYANFNRIELNGCEALNKIDAYIDNDSNLFNDRLSISNSIKMEVKDPTLEKIAKIIDFINHCNENNITQNIPYFKQIKNKTLKKKLTNNIINNIISENNEYYIDIPEIIIVKGDNCFLSDFDYKITYNNTKFPLNNLNIKEICSFIKNNDINTENFLDINIIFTHKETEETFNQPLKQLIYYNHPTEPYLFENGKWFTYNDVYLNNLATSLSEIEIEYDTKYDFKKNDYEKFINKKYQNNTENKTKDALKKKYYKEYVFNCMRKKDGFILNDRNEDKINNYKIEIADLFNENLDAYYAVKIGDTSSKLSYVIDQSLITLQMIINNEITETKNPKIKELSKDKIKDIYLWLIFNESKKKDLFENGEININKLNLLIFKNKLDDWKKEVIKHRYNPKIKINFINF